VNKQGDIRITLRPGLDLLNAKVAADLGYLLALASRAGGDAHDQGTVGLATVAFGDIDIGIASHCSVSLIEYDQGDIGKIDSAGEYIIFYNLRRGDHNASSVPKLHPDLRRALSGHHYHPVPIPQHAL